jgi:putative oxidoreductase
MLNPFPDLLNYALLAPFILRAVVGLIFLDLGFLKFKAEKQRWLASFETLGLRPADFFVPLYGALQIVGGLLLILGLYTQVAALFFVLSTGAELFVETRAQSVLKRDYTFYLLLFVISISLLLTGAGAFAFDIPL